MSHLHPFEMETEVGGEILKIHVMFGWHVFTDEKGKGKLIRQGKEERYFSRDRYDASHQAVSFLKERSGETYCVATHGAVVHGSHDQLLNLKEHCFKASFASRLFKATCFYAPFDNF